MSVILVAGFIVAAGVGGIARWQSYRLTPRAEVSILAVNILGSFLLGLMVNLSHDWLLVLGVGLIGAFTTFSTFAHEVIRLAKEELRASGYLIAATMVGCIAAAWIGIQLAPNF